MVTGGGCVGKGLFIDRRVLVDWKSLGMQDAGHGMHRAASVILFAEYNSGLSMLAKFSLKFETFEARMPTSSIGFLRLGR